MSPRLTTLAAMVFLAASSRLMPHPWNVTPLTAMALFAGAHFHKRATAFLMPLAALFLSDLILGLHRTLPFVYASFGLTVAIGFLLKRQRTISRIAMGTLASSILFFLLTNFGYWFLTPVFPKSFVGLMECYTIAIPFFRNMVLGDVFYTGLLFGAFAAAEKWVPVLRTSPT